VQINQANLQRSSNQQSQQDLEVNRQLPTNWL
jgi:hypothetical protein